MTADHDRMEDIVAAYALSACDDEERELVEAHLRACATCRALARRLSRTVDVLPLAVDEVRPPDRLRARILAAAAAGQPPRAEPEPGRARVLTLPIRRDRPRRRVPLHWAAVAVLAVALAGLGAWNVVLNQALHAAPPHYSMVGSGTLAGASGTVTEYQRDAALVSLNGMPQPPPGKVYQLWLIDSSGRPTSAGTFTPSAAGTARIGIDRPLAGVRTVAVTQEDGPTGARAPTQVPELAGQLGS